MQCSMLTVIGCQIILHIRRAASQSFVSTNVSRHDPSLLRGQSYTTLMIFRDPTTAHDDTASE